MNNRHKLFVALGGGRARNAGKPIKLLFSLEMASSSRSLTT